MPILLEAGDYTIRALFVNSYGVKSNVETQHYYINLAAPECPVINPESGCYTKPCLIEAYYDAGTKFTIQQMDLYLTKIAIGIQTLLKCRMV